MSKKETAHLRAAELLGVPSREIADVEEADIGTIITTVDGAGVMVHVPADRPDAEGKTGIMWHVAPPNYTGSFPVYSYGTPLEADDVAAEIPNPVDETTTAPAPVEEPFDRAAAELKAIELDVDPTGLPDEELVLAIQAAEQAKADAESPPYNRDEFIAEAETLGIAKPKRMSDDDLYAAVLAARPPVDETSDATAGAVE
jgi:hypothetical protein